MSADRHGKVMAGGRARRAIVLLGMVSLLSLSAVAEDAAPPTTPAEESGFTVWVKTVGHAIGLAFHDIGMEGKRIGLAIGHSAATFGKEVGRGAASAGKEVGHAAKEGGKAFGRAITGKSGSGSEGGAAADKPAGDKSGSEKASSEKTNSGKTGD